MDKKILLLVEDEIIIAMDRMRQLSNSGYSIIHAVSGEDAVSIVKNNDNIDMVLMDIDLGKGLNGVEAAEVILKYKNIPIIFLTSHPESEIVPKTEKINSCNFVLKSSGMSILNSSIKKHLI